MFELPTSGEGIKFYRYDNISNTNEFTAMYKSRLDSLEPSREQADKLVEEANVSFLLSIKMLKELDELSGFMEEVVHEQVELVDEREDDEPLASQKDEEKAHRKGNKKESTHEENVNGQQTPSKTNKQEPIGCFRIMAVAALVLAIMLGFTIRMVGQF